MLLKMFRSATLYTCVPNRFIKGLTYYNTGSKVPRFYGQFVGEEDPNSSGKNGIRTGDGFHDCA